MKKLRFFIIILLCSCASTGVITDLEEDEIYVIRKYVGRYVDFWQGERQFGDPFICYIETTQDSIWGKIGVYARVIKYEPGELLFISREYEIFPKGTPGHWVYRLQSNNSKYVYSLRRFTERKYLLLDNG